MQTENLKPYGYIYKITNKLNGKCYIGQTIHFEERIKKYKKLNVKGQPKIYRALKKYGVDSFTFELFDTAPDQLTLDFLEDIYVRCFDSIEYGYNQKPGGGNKVAFTEEIKKKISDAQRGQNSVWFGRKHTEEEKRKISLSHKGKKHTEETKQKMSIIAQGKYTGENNPMFGKSVWKGRTHSEETKRKMSDARKQFLSQTKSSK